MDNDKKTDIDVHLLPSQGMRDIHRSYGLWIIRVGGGRAGIDSFALCPKRYFQFYSISHMYEGGGMLWMEPDKLQPVHAGDCVVITPRVINRYGGYGGNYYMEDAINFCGPVADMLMRSGVLSSGVFPLGKVRRIHAIMEYAADPAVDAQIRANIELQRLAVDLYMNKIKSVHSDYPLLDDLLAEIRDQPEKWWSVQEMAELCNLSIDQMRRVFFQRTGVKPKIYVDRFKLNRAAEYLVNTNCSIADAAERFGYKDQYHFSRRFKAVLGMSPTQYRISIATMTAGQNTDE